MKEIVFTPSGVCCKNMVVEIKDGKITNVSFTGGCHGNLQGIASLVKGMDAKEVVTRLKGIDCKGKGTSCPDQLATCLEKHI
ncbi:MAG: TIGR03905 family TSCPD domain-containing protein [Bacteroidales bacterium]